MHKHTREYQGIEKLTQFENMLSCEEEENIKIKEMLQQAHWDKELLEKNIMKYKFQAD